MRKLLFVIILVQDYSVSNYYMKQLIYIFLLIIGFVSCQEKKTKSNYLSPDQIYENLDSEFQRQKDSSRNRQAQSVLDEKRKIDSVITKCDCNYYYEFQNLQTKDYGVFKYLICGYVGFDFCPDYPIGQWLNDSSLYLSGFAIFECKQEQRIIIEGSEYNIDSITLLSTGINLTRLDFFPITNKKGFQLTPVYNIQIRNQASKVVIDTTFILDFKGIDLQSLNSFYQNQISESNNEYNINEPDYSIEILYKFINAIENYPNGNKDFKELKVSGAATEEYYQSLLRYFLIFENNKSPLGLVTD